MLPRKGSITRDREGSGTRNQGAVNSRSRRKRKQNIFCEFCGRKGLPWIKNKLTERKTFLRVLREILLPNNEQNDEVCDATDDEQRDAAGPKKIYCHTGYYQ